MAKWVFRHIPLVARIYRNIVAAYVRRYALLSRDERFTPNALVTNGIFSGVRRTLESVAWLSECVDVLA